MTNKVELKSCHEVIDTVDVANIESIFYGKPTDPDILTVIMKDGKRLYCDEVCPMQEEPVSGLDNGDMPVERWKQAVEAASNQRNYRSSKGLTETRDDYFVDGVQWADEHPKKKHVSEEWIEELRTKLDSMSKEEFEQLWEKYGVEEKEEPVSSIWHDSGEMPKEKKVCLIRYSANDGASTNNFEVVIAEPLTRKFVTRSYPHKTGYQHTIHGENTIKVDEYQDRREYIPFSDIDEWAYIDDLLKLSNVQRNVKNWKEPNLSGYVARDEDGNLHVFEVEPRRMEEKHRWWDRDYKCHIIDNDAFPDLRWEDEPICVKLIIIKEE